VIGFSVLYVLTTHALLVSLSLLYVLQTRLGCLALLETALGDADVGPGFAPHAAALVLDAIMPNIVWRAGRVSGTIRKVLILVLSRTSTDSRLTP